MTTRADMKRRVRAAIDDTIEIEMLYDTPLINNLDGVADAVLDAVLPQITTAEQLEALPSATVLISAGGTVITRVAGSLNADKLAVRAAVALLPLTVVWGGDRWRDGDACILGPQGYEGGRYCYRHYGFQQRGAQVPWCDESPRHKANIPGVHLPHCNQWCRGDAHWLSDEAPGQPLDPAEQETRADA